MAKEEVKYIPWLHSSVAKNMWNLYLRGSVAVWLSVAIIAKKRSTVHQSVWECRTA